MLRNAPGAPGFELVRTLEIRILESVKATLTELARDTSRVLDRVIRGGETIQIQRRGKTVAQITPAVGVSREELLRVLGQIRWTEAESRELKKAMDAASEVFGYAGRD